MKTFHSVYDTRFCDLLLAMQIQYFVPAEASCTILWPNIPEHEEAIPMLFDWPTNCNRQLKPLAVHVCHCTVITNCTFTTKSPKNSLAKTQSLTNFGATKTLTDNSTGYWLYEENNSYFSISLIKKSLD